MNFITATHTELKKTKRTAAFWLTIIAASFIPVLFFLAYLFKPGGAMESLHTTPWNTHFHFGWQALSSFLFPMYVVLLCTLVPHIEYRNNTWKQVFAAPRSVADIYFSKFVTIHIMIFLFYVLFNFLMIATGLLINLIYPGFTFIEHTIDWGYIILLNAKMYLSVLGVSAIMYWLALRFKNFIAPMGIGLALLIGSIMALAFHWEHVYKLPFAHPILTLMSTEKSHKYVENHEWNALGYFLLFTLVGYLDLKLRKEKG
jgi:hypothetical protein